MSNSDRLRTLVVVVVVESDDDSRRVGMTKVLYDI